MEFGIFDHMDFSGAETLSEFYENRLKLAEFYDEIGIHAYHLAEHQSAEKTALEMGHRDTKMLFEHYRELVTKEAAKRYWKIR